MAHALRNLVESRADGRCEYCRRYQDFMGGIFFEMEHIIPRARGGLTIPDNLALACRRCNSLKGVIMEAIDDETGLLSRLFNPRTDNWATHFEWSSDLLQILGLTPIGRVTVTNLRLNDVSEQRAREIQRDYLAEIYPFD